MLARGVALDALPALAEVARDYGRLKSGEPPINVLCVFEDELYVWAPPRGSGGSLDDEDSQYGLRVFRLKNQRSQTGGGDDVLTAADDYQTLRPTRPIHNARDVRQVILNSTGDYVLLVCSDIVYACNLPPRNPSSIGRPFNADAIEPILVGRRHHMAHPDSRVLCAQWHPLSRRDSHIMVLTDDSVLRMYNLADMKRENGVLRVDRAEQAFVVNSRTSAARAVAFSTSRDATGWSRLAVNVLLSDASIISLCPVLPRSSRMPRSQLEEMREAAEVAMADGAESANVAYQWITQVLASIEDDGDASHEALCNITWPPVFVGMAPARIQYSPPADGPRDPCSLLCIGNVPSALAIGTKSGSVHVGFILAQVYGRWESVEERSQVHQEWVQYEAVSLGDRPVALIPDKLSADRFLAQHEAGIHRIAFASLALLHKFLSDEADMPSLAPLEVHELVRTALPGVGGTSANPVLGVAIVADLVIGYSLIALLGSGAVVRKLLYSVGPLVPNTPNATRAPSGSAAAPQDRSDLHQEVIRRLAGNELPSVKLAADVDDAAKLRFLKDYIQKCREQRIAQLYEIAELLADRKEQVRLRAADQQRKLDSLEAELAAQEQLAAKLRTEASVLGEELRAACEALRHALAGLEMQGEMSEAEKEYLMELRKMSRNIKNVVAPSVRKMERRADQARRTLKELEGPAPAHMDKREQDVSATVQLMQSRLQKAVGETKRLQQDFDQELNLKGADLL